MTHRAGGVRLHLGCLKEFRRSGDDDRQHDEDGAKHQARDGWTVTAGAMFGHRALTPEPAPCCVTGHADAPRPTVADFAPHTKARLPASMQGVTQDGAPPPIMAREMPTDVSGPDTMGYRSWNGPPRKDQHLLP